MEEAFLEFAGGDAAARVETETGIHPSLCETDHDATKEAQCKSGIGVADPALVLAQSDVQSVVEAAFDDPVAALEFEAALRMELLQGEAANEVNDFVGFLTLAPDPPPQPGDGLDSWKVHLLRAGFLAIEHSDLVAVPVVLPGHRVGAWRGPRGKIAVGSTAWRGFQRESFDFY